MRKTDLTEKEPARHFLFAVVLFIVFLLITCDVTFVHAH